MSSWAKPMLHLCPGGCEYLCPNSKVVVNTWNGLALMLALLLNRNLPIPLLSLSARKENFLTLRFDSMKDGFASNKEGVEFMAGGVGVFR